MKLLLYKGQVWGLVGSEYQFLRPIMLVVPFSDGTTAGHYTDNYGTDPSYTVAQAMVASGVMYNPEITFYTKSSESATIIADLSINAGLSSVVEYYTAFPSPNMRIVFDSRRYIQFVQPPSGPYYLMDYYLDGVKVGRMTTWTGSDMAFPGVELKWANNLNCYMCVVSSFPWMNPTTKLIERVVVGWRAETGGSRPVTFDRCTDVTRELVQNTALEAWYEGLEPFDADDPYSEIDDSTPSGPAEGTGIPSNDPVDIPDLPTVSAIDTGFVSLFNPTLAEVKALADYMWTNSLFDINTFKKIFDNPMDCILGFNLVPVNVPSSGSIAYVTVGNIISNVTMTLATSQWVELDCGTVDIGLPYGNYLDYAPATKFSIYLPYIGIKELSTDDVAGKALHLVYHVDVLSCACVAYLKCGDSVLYQFAGSCGYSIPVTGNDFSRMISSIIDMGMAVGGAVAGGNGFNAAGSIAKDVMGLKPDIHRSGSIGSSAGLMGLQKPYLIVELPNACKPKKQYHYLGYPSFVTVKLGDISGFASFENVLLEGIPCTDAEREIILSMCKGGIYL